MTEIEERRGTYHRWIHYYEPPEDVVCFKFPVLSWANGCPYSCAYCYLRQTLWRQKTKMVVWTDYEILERQIGNWLKKRKKVELLNAGELADSLAVGHYSTRMLNHAVAGLDFQEGLYLLTKGGGAQLGWLARYDGSLWPNVVVAFSVNADSVARRWETGAASSDMRLARANALKHKGWRVRLRIDPMIPFPDWRTEYGDLAEMVNLIKPERVTLGSLRANRGLRTKLPHGLWEYLSDDYVGGKYRIAPEIRAEMYRFVGERLDMPVSLCKETKEMWQESGAKGPCVCLP